MLRDYSREWLAGRHGEPSTLEALRSRVNKWIIPEPGALRLADIKPSRVQSFISGLPLAAGTARGVFTTLSAILNAAVDDELISSNPCRKASVSAPRADKRKVIPWTAARVASVRGELPERWRVFCEFGALCGLRQGEILGLDVDQIEMLSHVLHVRQQLRLVSARLVLAPPKGGKERDVPLPEQAARAIAVHLARFPAVEITLPWRTPDGPKRTARLLLTTATGKPINRNAFNEAWRPAIRAAGLVPSRETGTHQLRHRFASLMLAGGVDIKKLSVYLGHSSAGFTLATYTHLMESADTQARKAIEAALAAEDVAPTLDQEGEQRG